MIFEIARHELRRFACSPVLWLLAITFLVQAGYFFLTPLEQASFTATNSPDSVNSVNRSMTEFVFSHLINGVVVRSTEYIYFIIPLITMGLLSSEVQSGSISLLFSSPIRIGQVILGKYLAVIAICLLFVLILLFVAFIGHFYIPAFDLGLVAAGILGMFLLGCVYASIGLFVSSLTKYPVVAALLTLASIIGLNALYNLSQNFGALAHELFRRFSPELYVYEFHIGLVSSKNVVFFVALVGMFLTFTFVRLTSVRNGSSLIRQSAAYLTTIACTLGIGYIASQTHTSFYLDATQTQKHTLSKESQEILSQIQGDWHVTTYSNVLNENGHQGLPKYRIYRREDFDPYTRFNPNLSVSEVLYFDRTVDVGLYERFPDMSNENLAKRFAQRWSIDLATILSPTEIREHIDLSQENNRLTQTITWQGRSTKLWTHDDINVYADEATTSAALRRLLRGAIIVGVTQANGERRTDVSDPSSYRRAFTDVSNRSALAVHGFDFREIDAVASIPDDVDILLIADPEVAFDSAATREILNYIDEGRNMMLIVEPASANIVRPILERLGVRIDPLVEPSRRDPESGDLGPAVGMTARLSENAATLDIRVSKSSARQRVAFNSAGAIRYESSHDFLYTPLLEVEYPKSGFTGDGNDADALSRSSDLQLKPSKILASALTRSLDDNEQRIILVADGDIVDDAQILDIDGPAKLNSKVFHEFFRWLSGGLYPVRVERAEAPDRHINIEPRGFGLPKLILLVIIPGLALLVGGIHLARRQYS